MDYKIIWSPDALDDIEAIGEYIARDSEFYAESTVLKIYEAPQSLINLPKLGRVVPEIGDEAIRELLVLHTMIEYPNYDKALIVSGDGDFYCLVEYLKGKDKLLKLMIPNRNRYSSLFRKFSQDMVFMNDLRGKMEYKRQ
jgi:plasmid stabilization system protein ParE